MTPDIFVYLVDMPVREAVTPCDGFCYTVYINARLSDSERQRAFLHALRHILRDDWERDDVQTIEAEAHLERG